MGKHYRAAMPTRDPIPAHPDTVTICAVNNGF